MLSCKSMVKVSISYYRKSSFKPPAGGGGLSMLRGFRGGLKGGGAS